MADRIKQRGCLPSNGAMMLFGAGLVVPAGLILLSDKTESGVAEVVFVIAGIIFFTGLVRLVMKSVIARDE